MKKMIAVVMAVCLFALAGCGAKKAPAPGATGQSGESTPTTSASGQPGENSSPALSLQQRRATALKALSAVALNKATFINTDVHNKAMYLKDLTATDMGAPDKTVPCKLSSFQVLDLDGDGVPEVVIEVKMKSSAYNGESSEILRYYQGKVYSYIWLPVSGELGLDGGSFAKKWLVLDYG
ncbi:MAG: hypothetical protein FWD65_01600 [Coriobacteriia bacterium]|nr:hypothetical protein [Coriobacteriia bacterium]